MIAPKPPPRSDRIDPVVIHSRREALVILGAFVLFLVWSVSACYLTGYHEPTEHSLPRVLGMPSWVFWGVLVPWFAADLFSLWFCLFFMVDDPLPEAEEEDAPGPGVPGCRDAGEEGGHA